MRRLAQLDRETGLLRSWLENDGVKLAEVRATLAVKQQRQRQLQEEREAVSLHHDHHSKEQTSNSIFHHHYSSFFKSQLHQLHLTTCTLFTAWMYSANTALNIRRQLVRELVGIFRLRRVHRSGGGTTTTNATEYRILHVSLSLPNSGLPGITCNPTTKFSSSSSSSKNQDRVNVAMTHVIHFLCLLAAYLDVPLPCPITCKSNNPSKFFITGVGIGGVVSGGSTTLNDVSSSSSSSSSPCPLYVTDDNMDRFLMGVAMLNVNVSALAHGQGVYLVTNSNTTGGDGGVKLTPALLLDTLAHLALCCQSRFLGRDQQQPHPLLLVKYSTASATSSSTLQHPLYLDRHFHMDIAKVYHSHLVQLGMISLHGGGQEKEEEDEKEKRGRRRRELLDEELVEKPPAAAASSSSAAAAIAMDEEVLDVVVLEEEKMNRNVDGPRQQHQQQTLTFSSSGGDDAWLML